MTARRSQRPHAAGSAVAVVYRESSLRRQIQR